ncbi:hypothetical protein POTOM_051974 [Populus tomentosa]|uniref:Uncharacterized protein n=1 Tax=Populus tomentosa TaxID=118781 RepID=A0A8X7YAL4_POPTO|nr:hypothetical protein POTOM_051974 [Populus tomentosa]
MKHILLGFVEEVLLCLHSHSSAGKKDFVFLVGFPCLMHSSSFAKANPFSLGREFASGASTVDELILKLLLRIYEFSMAYFASGASTVDELILKLLLRIYEFSLAYFASGASTVDELWGSINHENAPDAFQEISAFLITMKQLIDYYLEPFDIAIDNCYGRIAFGEQNREDASWSKLGKLVSIVTAGGGLLNQLQKESSLPKEQEIIMEQEGTYRYRSRQITQDASARLMVTTRRRRDRSCGCILYRISLDA